MSCPNSILIVDDDFDLRDILRDVLEIEGYAVATAGDGNEALDYLRTNDPPCVILLDWMMPRCNGPQFRSEQQKDATIADIPVVLVTADARGEEKKQAIGVPHCLMKPLQLDRLLALIEQYC
jgi:CheY-like chemotaxis protein